MECETRTLTEVGGDTTVAFDGVTVTLAANTGGTAIAADYVTKYNTNGTGTYTAVDNGDGTVTFTANTTGARTDVAPADFVVTDGGSPDGPAVDVTNTTVDTQGAATGGAGLTLHNMANDGTVELTEGGAGVVVDMLDATGSADSLNVKVSIEDTITAGTVTAADVETINVESNDIFTDVAPVDGEDDNVAAHTLTIGGNDATTVMVTATSP